MVVQSHRVTSGEDASLADLVEELNSKLEAGDPVDIEAYLAEHPHYAGEVRELLPAMRVLANLGHSQDKRALPASHAKDEPVMATHTLGDYRIIREIGRGGMGVVYEAEQISLGRRVALKVLPFAAVMDQRQLARFKNEAQAAGLLHHTNIVAVHGVGCERGVHYYSMDYIEGHTLAEVIGQLRQVSGLGAEGNGAAKPVDADLDLASRAISGTLARFKQASGFEPTVDSGAVDPESDEARATDTGLHGGQVSMETGAIAALSTEQSTKSPQYFRTIAQLGIQAAEALDHAHKQGILHRDVKPANFILDNTGNLWVTDFGLARMEANPGMTMTGDLIGTLRYMSPEQALAKRVIVDHRTDVYSLGVTLYELLTLHPAYPGRDRQELLKQIAFTEPKFPRRVNPAIPAELETITLKAMAKNPEERYATAQELADDLHRWLDQRPIHAKRPSFYKHVVKWTSRNATWVATVAAVVTVAAIATSVISIKALIGARQLRIAEFEVTQERLARQNARWAREQAIPMIQSLIDTDHFSNALALIRKTDAYLPNDPTLAKLLERSSERTTVITEPPGANIYIRPYGEADAEWRLLGRTPIHEVVHQRGSLVWKITKQGYAAVQRLKDHGAESLSVRLDRENDALEGMVRVPSGIVRFVGMSWQSKPVELEDFFIDRFEVTNRQFKEFVDRGGYETRTLWKHDFVENGVALTWEQAMRRFVDSTGQSGPRFWHSGTYSKGEDDFPVCGVSWYEAAAYAEFVNKSLPTVYHWLKAAGWNHFAQITANSNFNSSGPSAVGLFEGMGPFGTFDMAGNVSEWCFNSSETDDRFNLGGSWRGPSYMFHNPDMWAPMVRNEESGFRCIQAKTDDASGLPWSPVLPDYRDFIREKPVSHEEFRILRRMYSYDKMTLFATTNSVDETPTGHVHESVSFDAAYGNDRVTAHLFLPKNAALPYQTVIYFPGDSAFERREVPTHRIQFLLDSGRAVFWPAYKGTLDRKLPQVPEHRSSVYRDLAIQWVKDLQRSVDYLEQRSDLDHENLAYYGFSWGAAVGPLCVAVEKRIKVAVFALGGFYQSTPYPEVDQLNFAPHVTVPVLMINSRNDKIFPYDQSQLPMFRALGTAEDDKVHRVFETVGHGVPFEDACRESVAWLDRYLGPPN